MTDYAVVVTWPQYPITTSAGHVTGLGHAGVVIVDGGSGATRYFEYGRYGDKDSEGNRAGAVLTKSVKNLTISDGAITQSSFEKMIDGLSHSAGKNTIAHALRWWFFFCIGFCQGGRGGPQRGLGRLRSNSG